MFSKGEYVVYSTNGICLIEDIGPMRNSEEERQYYILRPNASSASVLYVPLDNTVLCGKMRYVFSTEQLNGILAQVKADALAWIDDRKTRMNTFKEMLHSGDMKSLILLAGCIYEKKENLAAQNKRLSDADDHVLRSAERIVQEEFAWSFGIEKSSVPEYIHNSLSV